jgi:RimJ/RimL family protein N-acetyltransferase
MGELRTRRLWLRHWRADDAEPFAALNSDPAVMAHFPSVLSRAQSDELAERIADGLDRRGWGLWAVEIGATGGFAGFIGLQPVAFDAPFTPAVEIGWRLARTEWGRGYASEGARGVLAHAFGPLGLNEVVSFTVPANRRSRRVMEAIGMRHDPAGDFDHPGIRPDHPLRRHVLYRIARPDAG